MKTLLYVSIVSLVMSLVAFGQTTTPGTTTLNADLSPQSLVPPMQDRTESGQAAVEVTMVSGGSTASNSAVVTYSVTLENTDATTVTGFSIREGASGLNGPVVVEAQIDTTTDPPSGNTISGQMTVTGSTQLDSLNAILENPGGYYVLITGAEDPSGFLRGQLSTEGNGGEMDDLSSRVDAIQDQLDTIQLMIRRIGRVLGISPDLLPMPEGTSTEGNSGSSN